MSLKLKNLHLSLKKHMALRPHRSRGYAAALGLVHSQTRLEPEAERQALMQAEAHLQEAGVPLDVRAAVRSWTVWWKASAGSLTQVASMGASSSSLPFHADSSSFLAMSHAGPA